MPTPRQQRDRSIAFLLLPSAALVATIVLLGRKPQPLHAQILQGLLAVPALLLGAMGIGAVSYYHGLTRRHDRILSGRDVLARWSVPLHVWQQFLAREAADAAASGEPSANRVTREHVAHSGSVEVIFGGSAVLVDGVFHCLRRTDGSSRPHWQEGCPPSLIFSFSLRTDEEDAAWCIAVPVPPGAEPAARTVFDHYIAAG